MLKATSSRLVHSSLLAPHLRSPQAGLEVPRTATADAPYAKTLFTRAELPGRQDPWRE